MKNVLKIVGAIAGGFFEGLGVVVILCLMFIAAAAYAWAAYSNPIFLIMGLGVVAFVTSSIQPKKTEEKEEQA